MKMSNCDENVLVDNITVNLIKYHNHLKRMFYSKVLNLNGKKVEEVGKSYKYTSVLIFVIVHFATGFGVGFYFLNYLKSFPTHATYPYLLTYEIGMLAYYSLTIRCILFHVETHKNLILKLSRVISELNGDDSESCRRFGLRFKFLMIGLILWKILTISLEKFTYYQIGLMTYQLVLFFIDAEILFFLTHVDLVSKSFRILNQKLLEMAEEEFFVVKTILSRIWIKDSKNDLIKSKRLKKENLQNHLLIFNELAEIVDSINTIYGIVIFFSTLFIILGFLANMNISLYSYLGKRQTKRTLKASIKSLVWGIHQILRLGSFILPSEVLESQIEETAITVNYLFTDCSIDDPSFQVLEMFSKQISQRNLKMNYNDSLYFDLKSFFEIMGLLFSFTIIIVLITVHNVL